MWNYYPPSGDLYFDILTRIGTAASYDTVEAELKRVETVTVRVASPRALYRLKKDTVRPLDQQDAAMLSPRSISVPLYRGSPGGPHRGDHGSHPPGSAGDVMKLTRGLPPPPTRQPRRGAGEIG